MRTVVIELPDALAEQIERASDELVIGKNMLIVRVLESGLPLMLDQLRARGDADSSSG